MKTLIASLVLILSMSVGFLAFDSTDSLNAVPQDDCDGQLDTQPADPATEALRAKLGRSDTHQDITL